MVFDWHNVVCKPGIVIVNIFVFFQKVPTKQSGSIECSYLYMMRQLRQHLCDQSTKTYTLHGFLVQDNNNDIYICLWFIICWCMLWSVGQITRHPAPCQPHWWFDLYFFYLFFFFNSNMKGNPKMVTHHPSIHNFIINQFKISKDRNTRPASRRPDPSRSQWYSAHFIQWLDVLC